MILAIYKFYDRIRLANALFISYEIGISLQNFSSKFICPSSSRAGVISEQH